MGFNVQGVRFKVDAWAGTKRKRSPRRLRDTEGTEVVGDQDTVLIYETALDALALPC